MNGYNRCIQHYKDALYSIFFELLSSPLRRNFETNNLISIYRVLQNIYIYIKLILVHRRDID